MQDPNTNPSVEHEAEHPEKQIEGKNPDCIPSALNKHVYRYRELPVGVKAAVTLSFLVSLSLIVVALFFVFEPADATFSFDGQGVAVGAVGVSGFFMAIFVLLLVGYKSLFKLIATSGLLLLFSSLVIFPILLPRFGTASASSKDGTLLNRLWMLNNSMELYASENDGRYPNLVQSQWDEITDGLLLDESLVNPFTNSDHISSMDGATLLDGWAYKESTGTIYAVVNSNDRSSVLDDYPFILYISE